MNLWLSPNLSFPQHSCADSDRYHIIMSNESSRDYRHLGRHQSCCIFANIFQQLHFFCRSVYSTILFTVMLIIKGDPSGNSQPPDDIKTKVAYKEHILKHNFCLLSTGGRELHLHFFCHSVYSTILFTVLFFIKGDPSSSSQVPDDMKTKVAF